MQITRSIIVFVILALSTFFLFLTTANAQSAVSYRFLEVVDTAGKPVTGAKVETSVLSMVHLPLVVLGLGIALVETLIGCGLLFYRTRKLSVWLAVAMHGLVLGLLIASGYNSIVWVWNITLMLLVVVLFWQSDTSPWKLLINWRTNNLASRLAQTLAIATALLPILSFCNLWDMYLSGALYSGNTVVAVVNINEDFYKQLPQTAQQQVFKIKNGE
ncbi:MAG: hypothetical protein AB1489_06785 [Acidobacteriota bacterium]